MDEDGNIDTAKAPTTRGDYLIRIETLLRDRGFRGTLNVLNSAGGVVPASEARPAAASAAAFILSKRPHREPIRIKVS